MGNHMSRIDWLMSARSRSWLLVVFLGFIHRVLRLYAMMLYLNGNDDTSKANYDHGQQTKVPRGRQRLALVEG